MHVVMFPCCHTVKTGKIPGIWDFTAFQNVDSFSEKGRFLVESCLMLRSATVPRYDAEAGLQPTTFQITNDSQFVPSASL